MKTRITELLGIKHPVIQSGMNFCAYPPLVAAASNAGGMGILGAATMSIEELRQNIAMVRQLTDKPFGVNLLGTSPALDELIEVIVEERVPVACFGRGDPKKIIERTRPHGIISLPTIGAVRHALRVESYGAHALIVQGMEGGGHTGYIATTVLLPAVVKAVKIPVVAAGGFCDARGLVAALAFGAEGIAMGTRFALTNESPLPDNIKQRYLRSTADDAVITPRVTGTRCRGLQNKLVETLEGDRRRTSLRESMASLWEMKREFDVPLWKLLLSGLRMKQAYQIPLGELEQALFGRSRIKKALVEGDEEWGFMPGGQVCGRIEDIPTCQELIERIVYGAESLLEEMQAKVKG